MSIRFFSFSHLYSRLKLWLQAGKQGCTFLNKQQKVVEATAEGIDSVVYHTVTAHPRASLVNNSPSARAIVHDLAQIVESRLSDPSFHVDALAAHFGVSRVYLHLVMRQVWDVSPSEYLTQSRLKRAQELLTQGLSVKEMVQQTGFSTAKHFYAVFKRHNGFSFQEWRKTHSS